MATPSNSTALRIVAISILVLASVVGLTIYFGIDKPLISNYLVDLDASKFGYTWSLIIPGIPLLLLLYWYFHPVYSLNNRHYEQKKCLFKIAAIITVTWLILDILLAPSIFYFPNCGAVLSPPVNLLTRLPGYLPGSGFSLIIPIEEFLFYLFAAFIQIMLYIWFSEVWFFKYGMTKLQYQMKALTANVLPISSINPAIVLGAIAAVIVAYLLQLYFGHVPSHLPPTIPAECQMPQPPNFTTGKVFPLYFVFILLLVAIPCVFLYNRLKDFINIGALHMTVLIGGSFSLIWEATLAIPYGWWGYQSDFMIGLYVFPWFHLPIEAALLWISSTWGTVFLYELYRLSCITNISIFSLTTGMRISFDPFSMRRIEDVHEWREFAGVDEELFLEEDDSNPKNQKNNLV